MTPTHLSDSLFFLAAPLLQFLIVVCTQKPRRALSGGSGRWQPLLVRVLAIADDVHFDQAGAIVSAVHDRAVGDELAVEVAAAELQCSRTQAQSGLRKRATAESALS
jgi:hypothetical protein